MRSLILSLLFVAISIVSYGQAVETCADSQMPANVAMLTPAPSVATTLTIDPTWTTNAEGYTPTNVGVGFATAYWTFTVNASGFYTINIEGAVGSPAIGNAISISLDATCAAIATGPEIFADNVPANFAPETATCTNFVAGTNYTIAMAMDPAFAGDIIVTVVNSAGGATNITCGAADEMFGAPTPGMDNIGDNSCSAGLVWYDYTVVVGGSVTLTASTTGAGTDIPAADLILTQYSIDNCLNFTPVGGTTVTLPCLPVGTVISFEVGDEIAPIEQGTFTVTISDDPTGVTNETCADVPLPVTPIPTCMTTELTTATTNTTMGACPDVFSGCPTFEDEATVWFSFMTDGTAQTVDIEIAAGSIATEFALIDATAGCPSMGAPATAIGGCQTGGSLLNQAISANTTYYIAVSTAAGGTDGTFALNVTPQNPPANDLCAMAQDISPTSATPASGGVDGTTACATNDLIDFCGSVTEDHVVYYTYTVDAAITTNRTITITTVGNTVPSGTAATSLGYGIWADCLGAAATMPSTTPLLPISGDVCDPLNAPIVYECVEPGTSFTIAVASTDLAEGDFNIMITEEETGAATNDVCDAGNPDITTVSMGTNFCADGELSFCGMSLPTDHQVWYSYTNNTGANVDLGLTFTGTAMPTSATDLSMLVLTGNCSSTIFPGTTDADYCSILDAGEQIISCIENGETISILLGSAEDPSVLGPEGNFNIAFNEISNKPANDECTGAIDITPPTCIWTLASTLTPTPTAENACSEDFATFPAGCDFTTEATVWYSITVPNDGETYALDIQNISDDAFLSIFESTGGDCDSYGTPSISADCETGNGPHGTNYDDLMNGATYFIAVGDPTEASGFDFEIRLNLLPANDECANAVVLADNTATDGTTACATQEAPAYNGACADVDETNTVWYQYTVPAGNKGFHITLAAGTTAFTAPIITSVFDTDACDISAATLVGMDNCTASAMVDEQFECIGPGTYTIMVSTSSMNEGDFQITITPIMSTVANDNCDAPDMSLDPGMECVWMPATATTIDACPEDMNLDPTDCGIDEFPVVWYSVTAPANATFLDLQITGAGSGVPFMAVYDDGVDCDNLTFVTGSTCYSGIFADLNALGQNQITVTGGTTYLIAVGTDDLAGSTIDFEIKWITPPVNDECVNAIALAGNTATDGTTACATQEMTPYNGACADTDETNTVWYTYTVPAGDKGFHVTIAAGAIAPYTNPIITSVFETDACDISAATLVGMDNCAASGLDEQFECVGPGTYTIMVSTSAANEGNFQITITPIMATVANDNCDNPDVSLNPGLECEWMDIMATTTGACPEDMNLESGGCMLDMFPVTWYEVTAPVNAEFLDLRIISGGINPFLSVFEPGVDCDALVNVAGSGCVQGPFTDLVANGNALIDVTPGNTYLIAVGSQNTAGTIVDFGIKWITPPANDDCDMAEMLTPVAGTTGPIPGTTQCATVALTGSDCDLDKINTVWYTYTVEPNVKEITIDVTNWTNTVAGGTPDLSVAVLNGCLPGGQIIPQANGDPADYCGGEGTDLITLSCLDVGDVITILVSSSSENEGTFDITLNTSIPDCNYTNDECDDAVPYAGTIITDDPVDCNFVMGCNDLACSEFDFSGVCPGIDVLNSVFYTFTTDDLLDGLGNPVDAFVNIELINGQPGELDSPGAILLSGTCASAAVIGACAGTGGTGTFNSGPLGMPGQILPNTTYTVVVYNGDTDQNGGTFELCVTVSSGCVNDDICDAFTLDPGVTVDNPASSVGCTDDFDVSGCGAAQNEATLWYQVEVPEGASSITVTLTNQPIDGVTGDVSIAVGPLGDCNAFDATDVLYTDPNCTGFTTDGGVHTIDCAVEFGTYWIQIGSENDLEAGDFTIMYDFIMNPEPSNDLCSTAEDLIVTDICEFVTFPGLLRGACPEIFDLGACQFSMNQAVWYTITIPGGDPVVTDMDIEIMGLGNPMIGVFEYDCMTSGDPNTNGIINQTMNPDGTVDCSQMPLTEGIMVTPGNTYHILVSTSTMEDIPFDISIKLNAPPINDDPCNSPATLNPPFDLTGVGSHAGTTCCARGPRDSNPDGSPADLENVDCSDATEGSAVWYQFTPDENDEGYLLDFAGSTGGNVTVEVYWGAPDAGCNGGFGETIASSCTDQNVMFSIPNCPEPGDVMFVKVTTDDADDQCGDFTISITPAKCDITTATDDCINATEVVGPSATDINCESFDEVPFQGCLDYACPETVVGDCMFTDNPTVWIQVEVDDFASQLVVDITANGDWDPVWAIYTGPCDALTLVQGGTSGALTSCSNDDDSPAHQVPVESGLDGLPLTNTYYVAISAQGFEPGEDGSFSGTVLTTAGCVSCIGGNDDFSLACNNTSTWEITDRSSDRDLDDPQFCVGESVSMCASLDYDASATSIDWLHGVIPNFGPGWNVDDFDGATASLNATNGGNPGNWFEAGGDCSPFITETMPLLCTYLDDDGVLQICNDFCGTCPGNCITPLPAGNPLPSGWFWNGGPGSEMGCGDDCTPSDNYGIGAITTTVEICFTITVKDFDSFDDCVANNDLKISLITTSDGVSGCYEDPTAECTLDAPQFSPDWTVDCNTPPRVVADDIELCDEGTTDIFVSTEDGSVTTIIINPIPNAGVTGATMHEFTSGTGTIDDMLDNITTQTQVQQYVTFTVDPTKPCPGPIDTIEVTIYAEVMVELMDNFICEGSCTTLSPSISGGFGVPYTYLWSTGETTPTIEVCPVVATTYGVTVTDGFNCVGEDDAQIDVVPPVIISFEEDPIDACKDGNFDPFQPEYVATLSFESGSAPYSINWLPALGLVGQVTSVNSFNDSWIINEEATSALLSPYQLCAEVTDNFGCMGDTCMTVNITGEVTLVPEVLNLVCGVDNAEIRITGIETNSGNPVTDFNLFGGCPAVDLLETGFSNSGVFTFDINSTYLNNYSQFTIEGITSSGCVASICVDVDVPQGTPIMISGDENICKDEIATITIDNAATAGYNTYTWTPDVGSTQSVTVSPAVTTTYFVETMDGAGCVSDTSFTVNVNPEPVIGLSGTTTFCSGGTATIVATGGDTYNWTGTNGTASGDSYTADMPGVVDLEVVSAFGCVSDTTITFSEESVITVNIGGPSLCDEMPDTLFVVGSFTSYEWTFNSTIVGTDSILIISEAGTYNVNVVDVTLCPGEGTIEISNFTTPLAMVTDTLVVCNEDSGVGPVTVDFSAQVTGDLGTWSALTNVVPFDPNSVSSVDFTGATPGCYGYVYSTMNAILPCMNTSDTLYVCVEPCPCPLPTTKVIPNLCNDDTYNLTNAQVTLELGSWSVISGPAGQDLAGLIVDDEFVANGILAGTYTVEFTLTAPGNSPPCLVSSTQTIEVFEALEVTTTDGTMCNITGQAFPTTLDLYSLISFDDSDGGVWSQVGTPAIPITGGSMIDASDLTDFPIDLIFSYTSSDPAGPCEAVTVEVNVEIRDCACKYVNVLPDTLCNDGGLIDLTSLLENPDVLTGNWTVTPGAITGTNMFDSNVPSGAYTITYSLTESAGPGCDEMYSNTIIVRKKPEIEFVAGPIPCSENTGNGSTAIDLYDWLNVNNSSNGVWTQTGGSTVTFTDDGITAMVDFEPFNALDQFEFTYSTNVADDPCTDISGPITIVVGDCNCPPIALTDPDPICNDDGMLDLCALSGSSDPGMFTVFDSSGDDQSANIDETGCIFDAMSLAVGSYMIVYTLDQPVTGICDQADTVFVEVMEYASVTIADPEQVCSDPDGMLPTEVNFDALLDVIGGGVWSNDDGVLASGDLSATPPILNFEGVLPGNYNFTYTIDNVEPCDDFVETIIVNVTAECNCPPFGPTDPADVCSTDGPVDLTQYDDSDSPGTWSSTTLTVENGNSLITDGVGAGNYELYYTILTTDPDCPTIDTVDIMILEPVSSGTPADDLTLCEGDSQVIMLNDLLTGADIGGVWTETSGTSSTGFSGNTFDTDGQSAGTYTFQYEITGNAPCPDPASTVTIIINPNPIADAGTADELDCTNTSNDLGGTGTSTGGDFVYSWTLSGVEVGTDVMLTDVSVEGTYQLLVTNSVTGCVDSSSVLVTKSDAFPEFVATPVNITCNGDGDGSVIISDQNGGDGDYSYTLNGGASVDDPNSFTGLEAGDYTIAITDGVGCTSEQTVTILEPAPVSVTIESEGLVDGILNGEPGDEFILTIDPEENIDSVVWSDFNDPTIIFCSGSAAECSSITIAPTLNTTVVYVEVFDENGCSANDQVQIQLNQIVDVVFPNIISPNGDNTNDFFFIASDDVEQVLSMQIFDRWGELIWEKNNFDPRVPSEGWDGKFNESPVVPGVYVFTVEVLFVNNDTETFSGDVTVMDGE